jgi:hypothetical protein
MALRVLVDGVALPDDDARAFWSRFSIHMEEHHGDLAGFAKAEGFASVHPETHDGMPVLVVSRTAPQRAYANAPRVSSGSQRHQTPPNGGSQSSRKHAKHRKSR